jgi:hypothetical protein
MAKAKRRCSELTKKGKACKAPPIPETDWTTCMAHAPAEIRRSKGFVPDNGKGGRPKLPTPTEVAKRLIENNIAVVLRPHFRTLGFDLEIAKDGQLQLRELEGGGAKLFGESKDGEIVGSPYEDLGAMIAAAEKLLDRIYGKARQATELTGAGGEPLHPPARIPDDDDYHRQVAEVLVEAEVIKLSAERNGSRNGHG